MKRTTLVLACLLAGTAYAKVVTLDCKYEGWVRVVRVSMDTDTQMASTTEDDTGTSVGRLFTDGGDYWFTVRGGSTRKFQINRQDLSSIMEVKFSFVKEVMINKGSCSLAAVAPPKI